MDVVLGYAGQLGQHGETGVGFLDVELDLRWQRIAVQGLDEEAVAAEVAEQVVKQGAAGRKQAHRTLLG
ncbi:hypothetical protein D3C85_1569710 [compost metagenome]